MEEALRTGLLSTPKYIPTWYRYDKQGSIYNDRCLTDNEFYYFVKSETYLMKEKAKAVVDFVIKPCVLFEMGSGNSEKTKYLINAILEEQTNLKYFPIDISEDFLQEISSKLQIEYLDLLSVEPVPGDYTDGIKAMRLIESPKLIVWLGGLQNEPLYRQVSLLAMIQETMSGISSDFYLNALSRLNREMGSNIDTSLFELSVNYIENQEPNNTSYTQVIAKSKTNQSFYIPGLNITVTMEQDEPLNLFEGSSVSCKYTRSQIQDLARNGGLTLHKLWVDPNQHVALCCLKK